MLLRQVGVDYSADACRCLLGLLGMDDSVVISRNSRTTRPFTAAVLAVCVGLVLLPACTSNSTSNGSNLPSAASSSPAPSAAIKAVEFDETYRTDDGIVVEITEVLERKLEPFTTTDDPDAKEGDPYVLLNTKTTNMTEAAMELVPGAVLTYGPEKTAASPVLVDEIDGIVDLKPGEAYDYAFGFLIPKDSYDQVVMELTVTIEPLRTVVFSGAVRPT